MLIRFGYVSISKIIQTSANRTITYTNYQKLSELEQKTKLYQLIAENLRLLMKLLTYNNSYDIHFFRLTSSLIPLLTHPFVHIDLSPFYADFKALGDYIKIHKMRIDMHPDQFNVLNSENMSVVQNTVRNLTLHSRILDLMGLRDGKMILHAGSGKPDKETALKRFIRNFEVLAPELKARLLIENDDKVFHIDDILRLNKETGIPIVFDYQHHLCNPADSIDTSAIFASWNESGLNPKVHLSSPKSEKQLRDHADYIRPTDFFDLLASFFHLKTDFDIMIEAKMKDEAMFNLIEAIKKESPNWEWQDKTTLQV